MKIKTSGTRRYSGATYRARARCYVCAKSAANRYYVYMTDDFTYCTFFAWFFFLQFCTPVIIIFVFAGDNAVFSGKKTCKCTLFFFVFIYVYYARVSYIHSHVTLVIARARVWRDMKLVGGFPIWTRRDRRSAAFSSTATSNQQSLGGRDKDLSRNRNGVRFALGPALIRRDYPAATCAANCDKENLFGCCLQKHSRGTGEFPVSQQPVDSALAVKRRAPVIVIIIVIIIIRETISPRAIVSCGLTFVESPPLAPYPLPPSAPAPTPSPSRGPFPRGK